jgi:phage gpG-like protein
MADGIKVDGVSELVEKLRKLDGASDEIIGLAVFDGALVLEGKVKISMQQTPKGGKTYKRGKKTHTSSTPGSPPAIDYGFLIGTLTTERDGNDAIVYTSAEAGPPLELGTARMQARPFMRPAAENNKSEILAEIEASAKKRIEEGAA